MQVIKNPKLDIAKNQKWYIEAGVNSIEIGTRVVRDIKEHTITAGKRNRLSKVPAGTVTVIPAYTGLIGFITGAGQPYINDSGQRVQRFYIDNACVNHV